MPEKKAVARIQGRVQGVNFRNFVQEKARNLGLTGWVKNLADGDVEAVIEGDEEKVRRLLDFCREGPEPAVVSDVKVDWEAPEGGLPTFEVRF